MITGGKSSPKQEVMDYLEDKGYSSEAIAGITANIEVETGGTFDYKEQEKGKGKGEGLFQYTDTMKDSYNDYLNEFNKEDSMESQIDFMDSYIKGDIKYWNEEDEKMVPSLGYGNVDKLKDIFAKGKLETDYGNRKNIAMDIYKSM